MTRFGFFVYNILLIALVYLLIYGGGAKPAVIGYMLRSFSEPQIIIILLMTIFTSIRWFMHHDPDVGSEVATWVMALILVPAITVGALYLVGGIHGGLGVSMSNLMTVR